MPRDPVEFTVEEHRFRHTPLASMPLAREHHKLLTRFDNDSGALNALAFTFDKKDFKEIAEIEANGVFRLVKLISMLVGTDRPRGAAPEVDEDEDVPAKPVDELPHTLDGLYMYYANLGTVEYCADLNGSDRWIRVKVEDDFNDHPSLLAPPLCAFQVLKGIFLPFVGPLLAYTAKARERNSTPPTSKTAETSEALAPTSES